MLRSNLLRVCLNHKKLTQINMIPLAIRHPWFENNHKKFVRGVVMGNREWKRHPDISRTTGISAQFPEDMDVPKNAN